MKNKCERQLTIRLTTEQYNSLEKMSKDRDVSVATVVRWAIKNYTNK